jgi:hypothetical protein
VEVSRNDLQAGEQQQRDKGRRLPDVDGADRRSAVLGSEIHARVREDVKSDAGVVDHAERVVEHPFPHLAATTVGIARHEHHGAHRPRP